GAVYTGEMPSDDEPQMRKLLPPGFTPAGVVMFAVPIRSRRGPLFAPPVPVEPPEPVEPPPPVVPGPVVVPGPAPPAPPVVAPDVVVGPDAVEPPVVVPDVLDVVPLAVVPLVVPAPELVPEPDAGARPGPFDSLTPHATATRADKIPHEMPEGG